MGIVFVRYAMDVAIDSKDNKFIYRSNRVRRKGFKRFLYVYCTIARGFGHPMSAIAVSPWFWISCSDYHAERKLSRRNGGEMIHRHNRVSSIESIF